MTIGCWTIQIFHNLFASILSLSLTTQLNPYYLILLAPLLLNFNKQKFLLILLFMVLSCLLFSLNLLLENNWKDMLKSTFGFFLTVCVNNSYEKYFDLSLLAKVFDHFRSLFLCVFQLNTIIYVLPLSSLLRNSPSLLFLILLIVVALFSPYPSYAETALYLPIITAFIDLHKYLRQRCTILAFVLSPIMWSMWVNIGSEMLISFAIIWVYSYCTIHFCGQNLLKRKWRKKVEKRFEGLKLSKLLFLITKWFWPNCGQLLKRKNRRAPLKLTLAASGDAAIILGCVWIWRKLRHNEDNRRYCHDNYPYVLKAYYFCLNAFSFGEFLGDKQMDNDLARWIYNDVQHDNVGTLLSDVWELLIKSKDQDFRDNFCIIILKKLDCLVVGYAYFRFTLIVRFLEFKIYCKLFINKPLSTFSYLVLRIFSRKITKIQPILIFIYLIFILQNMVTDTGIRFMWSVTATFSFLYIANYMIKYDNKYNKFIDPIPIPSWEAYSNSFLNFIKMDNINEESENEIDIKRPKLSIRDLELIAPNKEIINQLILLNSIALPINFGDVRSLHYKRVLRNELAIKDIENETDDDEINTKFWTLMAYYNNALIGAITVCMEKSKDENNSEFQQCLYILTLAVLPAFRRRNVASILVFNSINECKQRWKNIKKIALHCQTINKPALSFYNQLGFIQTQFVSNYYSNWRISHSDAYKLEFSLEKNLN
ncbi:N-acetyltransferase domain-containing protein [Meloidogyne graminicola]|uniref:N-acetyltransferase domain-containing protein n=1 Tax=Meloidogyne graminicola TaxID=189291 RepID=A0A8S9ZAT4_9BILA|nr:N-acetyltransferase domain-containing protein [Meloidogyne graminicola]